MITVICQRCGKGFPAVSRKRKVCNECRTKKPSCEDRRSERKKYTRVCHDCERPTSQYRCPACWAMYREGDGNVAEGWEAI